MKKYTMKNINKKIVSVLALLVLLFWFAKITFAFPKMDVCNYTNWDSSGNYYDWYCTKDWKLAEDRNVNTYNQNTSTTVKKEKKNSELKHIKHYNGSSAIIWNFNSKNKEEIEKLKEIISKQNELIEKYKLENSRLLKNQNILLENIKQKDLIIEKVVKYNSSFKNKSVKKINNTSVKKSIKNTNNIEETIYINSHKSYSERELIKQKIREKILKLNAERAKNK